jgi:hypothetical protein
MRKAMTKTKSAGYLEDRSRTMLRLSGQSSCAISIRIIDSTAGANQIGSICRRIVNANVNEHHTLGDFRREWDAIPQLILLRDTAATAEASSHSLSRLAEARLNGRVVIYSAEMSFYRRMEFMQRGVLDAMTLDDLDSYRIAAILLRNITKIHDVGSAEPRRRNEEDASTLASGRAVNKKKINDTAYQAHLLL